MTELCFNEASITLILTSNTTQQKYRSKSLMNIGPKHLNKSKLNQTVPKKENMSFSRQIYPRGATVVQHLQINKCHTSHVTE